MTHIETIHFAQGVNARQRISVPVGATMADIAHSIHGATDGLIGWVKAPDGYPNEWIEVPRAMWKLFKGKVDGVFMFGYRLGRSALRSVLSIVAAVLVAVIAPFLAPFIGTLGAGLVAAAVGVGASMAINALFPPEQPTFNNRDEETARQFSNIESDSNILAKEAYLPIVVGERRISPPEIAAPFFFLESGVQTIQRIFGLHGHHEITDIQVDKAPVDDFESITTQIRDGAETTPVDTFIDKITHSERVGETLSTFSLDAVDLVDQETPVNSEPRWVRFTTAYDERLEEISLRLQINSFAKTDSATQAIRVPVRLRFREKGSSGAWTNIPEIHLVGRDISSSLKEIRLRWDDQFGVADQSGEISYEFFQQVPESEVTLSDGSSGIQWQADSSFVAGAGLMDTQNIQGRRNGLRITLDEVTHPKAEYEWEIQRGLAMISTGINTQYEISGTVQSLFVAKAASAVWKVPIDQGAFVSSISVVQATSIVDRPPCQRPGTALLAVKASGQSVSNITAKASRFVHDWDGTGWNTLTTSKNPATHFRQVLFDYLQYHGIDADLIANDQIVSWRAECEAQGYEVSAVYAGASIKEVLSSIAVAGFARLRASDGFGVDWFRNRSQERPLISFSPRNAKVSLDWINSGKPPGVRIKFQNEDNGYRDDELQINNDLYANSARYQVSNYSSISNPVLVRRRAAFDLLQTEYQGRRMWTVETAIEGLVCERGDLVSVITDLLSDASSGARIREVINANTFKIDQIIPPEGTVSIFDEPNIFDAENIFASGAQTVALFTTPTGTEMRTVTAVSGDTIRVDSNVSSTEILGSHIVLGPAEQFSHRCIVSDVQRQSKELATLVLVDEAPEIYTKIQEKFG